LYTNQDPADIFEELAAIEHAYSNTQAKLGDQEPAVAPKR